MLESAVRNDLNINAPRAMASKAACARAYESQEPQILMVPNHPADESRGNERSDESQPWIDREDFRKRQQKSSNDLYLVNEFASEVVT